MPSLVVTTSLLLLEIDIVFKSESIGEILVATHCAARPSGSVVEFKKPGTEVASVVETEEAVTVNVNI